LNDCYIVGDVPQQACWVPGAAADRSAGWGIVRRRLGPSIVGALIIAAASWAWALAGDERPLYEPALSMLHEQLASRLGPVPELPPIAFPQIELDASVDAVPGGPEAYSIAWNDGHLTIRANSRRGYIFAVGHLLRVMQLEGAQLVLPSDSSAIGEHSPAYPLRGHQLGYRAAANSYDAWDPQQYQRYIRELALFGANAIEMIPFQDDRPAPLMPVDRRTMDVSVSRICAEHDLEYWIWAPASEDLGDPQVRAELLAQQASFYSECPRLDGIFFPGGDPGHNPPELVLPFLAEMAQVLSQTHPEAKIWLSLQGFTPPRVDYVYTWLDEQRPDWLGGLVCGPGSPPIPMSRQRLDPRYGLRHYPDITHTVRSQYPTQWWDPAFAFTLGREPFNPEPVRYERVHNVFAPYTIGFLTYSDGINDDVNKALWTALGWDPQRQVREILIEYARLYAGPSVAQPLADALLALERNWQGPIVENGAIEGTLAQWQRLEREQPELLEQWRFQIGLLRAYYDAYVRRRAIDEEQLELKANAALRLAGEITPAAAAAQAREILAQADRRLVAPEWRARIFELCQALFDSIGLQSSVERYGAVGGERGAVLDYVDYPLNNRWWIESELEAAFQLPDAAAQIAALRRIADWEEPGPGGFYDDIGNVAKSPRVVRNELPITDPTPSRGGTPDFMWWNSGFHQYRQSWVSKMDWPDAIRYTGLDPDAQYVVRVSGIGQCLLIANGQPVSGSRERIEMGELNEFLIPPELTAGRELVLTFETPHEPDLNWRLQSRLSEVWLIRQPLQP
jgi:hypothetical protein